MLSPVREEAGLGSPPEPFYTNSSKCINNVLKVKVDYERTELSLFVASSACTGSAARSGESYSWLWQVLLSIVNLELIK